MVRRPSCLGLLTAACLLLTTQASCRGDCITGLEGDLTPQAGGLTRYESTLTNEVASAVPVFQFSLDVSPVAALSMLSGPSGWDIFYSLGDVQIIWSSPGSA